MVIEVLTTISDNKYVIFFLINIILLVLGAIMDMAGLMGARAVFSGFRAGVVSSLVELDAEICGIDAAINLDIALEALIDEGSQDGQAAEEEGAADSGKDLPGAPDE